MKRGVVHLKSTQMQECCETVSISSVKQWRDIFKNMEEEEEEGEEGEEMIAAPQHQIACHEKGFISIKK